ncbi:MAG: hypothetical protein ACOY33_04225 [Pseudomonadota bacterium]
MNRSRPLLLLAVLLLLHGTLAAGPAPGPDHPRIREARQAIAAGDATGAKIALNILLEETKDRALVRTAQRMLAIDVALAEAGTQVRDNELFLVEGSLRAVEKKLGRGDSDRAARAVIADIRRLAEEARGRLRREDILMGLAIRRLLETEKLIRGDYPLLREDAERLLLPALQQAGDEFSLVDWKPTLRGYRLLLQDKRTGESFEVTPD